MESEEKKETLEHNPKKIHGFVAHTSRFQEMITTVKEFFKNPSYPRTLTIISILVIALAIPVTITVLGKTTHFFQFAYQGVSGGGAYPTPVPTINSKQCVPTQVTYCNGTQQCTKINNYNNNCYATSSPSCSYILNKCNYSGPSKPTVKNCTMIPHAVDFTATISWAMSQPGVSYIDISSSSNFSNYSHIAINNIQQTSISNVPNGFSPSIALSQGPTYFVRTWDGHNHSATTSFTFASCAPPPPTPTPLPSYVQRCGQNKIGFCVYGESGANAGQSLWTDNPANACWGLGVCSVLTSCNDMYQGTVSIQSDPSECGGKPGMNYYCCADAGAAAKLTPTPSKITPSPSPVSSIKAPVCTSPSSCELAGGIQGAYCGGGTTTPEFWCNPPSSTGGTTGSTHGNYGPCAGLSTSQSICTDTSCPSGFSQTSSNACSGKAPNGLTKICCTNTNSGSSSGGSSGGSGGSGGGTSGGGSSCQNGLATSFNLTFNVPGIGKGNFQNANPQHMTRFVKVEVVDLNNNKAVKVTPRNGNYSMDSNGTISFTNVQLGTALGCGGNYKAAVTLPGGLRVLSNQAIQYGKDTSTNNLTATPLLGDIVNATTGTVVSLSGGTFGDNKIDINDYNIMKECLNVDPNANHSMNYFGKTITFKCGDVINLLDYPDGGTQEAINSSTGINEWGANYNELLRSWIASGGNGQ